MCSVIELGLLDDVGSVRDRLRPVHAGRVALELPWGMDAFSRRVDFELLRREAERRQVEIAIVSQDPDHRRLAREAGLPAFSTAAQAQKAKAWRRKVPQEARPPRLGWWEEAVELDSEPLPADAPLIPNARLSIRLAAFGLAVLVLAAAAYAVVPSGVVTLVPEGSQFETVVAISVDPEADAVDQAARVVPARALGVYVEDYAEIETTGVMFVPTGWATGEVLFTNLLGQDYTVPAGTVVRTSSTGYPLRFQTSEEVVVPAGGQTTAPIEALERMVGNIAAFQINRVEGVAGSAVRVTNPYPTRGAEGKEAPMVSEPDRAELADQLTEQLLEMAYDEMGQMLGPTEILFAEALRVEAVPKRNYTHMARESADRVGLQMRLLVSGLAIDGDDAKAVAYIALSSQLPSDHLLVDARFAFGEVAEEDIGPGRFTFFVTARGYSTAALNVGEVIALVRGKSVSRAQERLLAAFPLAQEPAISVWPVWPGRMPVVPVRISVRIEPRQGDLDRPLVAVE
jgi:hypothetical protein